MNNNLVIQCILTVIGWIVVYILALRQNTQIKKKEVTIKFWRLFTTIPLT